MVKENNNSVITCDLGPSLANLGKHDNSAPLGTPARRGQTIFGVLDNF